MMELPSRLELPNLLITNEVLYRLSYGSMLIQRDYITLLKDLQHKFNFTPLMLCYIFIRFCGASHIRLFTASDTCRELCT